MLMPKKRKSKNYSSHLQLQGVQNKTTTGDNNTKVWKYFRCFSKPVRLVSKCQEERSLDSCTGIDREVSDQGNSTSAEETPPNRTDVCY